MSRVRVQYDDISGGGSTYGFTSQNYTGRSGDVTIPIKNGMVVAWDTTQYVHAIYVFEEGQMTKLLEYSPAQASGTYDGTNLKYNEYYNVTLLIYKVD